MNKHLTTLIAWVFGLGLLAPISMFGGELDLKSLMGEESFRSAGLDKLDPEELAFLQDWFFTRIGIEREAAVEEAVPSGETSFGLEQVAERVGSFFRNTPEVIESRIDGQFRGWSGRTVFRLENGQVWQQSGPGDFYYPAESPEVIIRKATLGTYLLQLKGMGSTVRVRRIE